MSHQRQFFRLSVITLSLMSGFASAETASTIDAKELPSIQVNAGLDSSTRRINMKKMDESTDTSLKEVLFNEPSINFGGGNGTSQWITIRGMGQDQIDFKVDNTYSDTQIFHHNSRMLFDPSLVKVIGVQKGTGSASAGIGATGGAIVAKTVDAKDLLRDGQQVGFKLNAGVSSNKGWNRGATVYGQYGGFDAIVSGNWVTEREYEPGHGYVNSTGGDTQPYSGLGQRGLLAKFGYNFNDDHRISLSHRQERTYGERQLREEYDLTGSNRADPRYRVLTFDTTNLEYQGRNIGFINKLDANIYYQTQKREENSSEIKNKTTGANIGLDSNIGEHHTLKYGINYRNQNTNPAGERGLAVREEKDDYGLYVEGIWHFAPVTVTTGLRYDAFDLTTSGNQKMNHGYLNPSLGVIYDVNNALSLNASLNYATRSPRLYEAALANNRRIVANNGLDAERARNIEIGFKYRPTENLDLEGTYFWQTINDVIDSECVTGLNGRTASCGGARATFTDGTTNLFNNGKIKNKGYEFSAAYRWKGLTARAGVAYNEPEWQKDRETSTTGSTNMSIIPIGRTWTAGLAYQFDNPNLELGWRGRFVQRAKEIGADRGQDGGVRAGYGVNDIYVNWKPTGKDHLNVNFAVNNVGNKLYKSHTQRGSGALYDPGRDFRLAINYRF